MMKDFISVVFFSVFVVFNCFSQAQNKDTTTGKIFMVVEEAPVFPGGDSALEKYLSCNSEISRYNSNQVTIQFVIDSTGKVINVRPVNPNNSRSDSIAASIIKKMPKWIPGKKQGKNVECYYRVPVSICE